MLFRGLRSILFFLANSAMTLLSQAPSRHPPPSNNLIASSTIHSSSALVATMNSGWIAPITKAKGVIFSGSGSSQFAATALSNSFRHVGQAVWTPWLAGDLVVRSVLVERRGMRLCALSRTAEHDCLREGRSVGCDERRWGLVVREMKRL